MPSVISVHFSHPVDHYVTWAFSSKVNIIEHTHDKLLVRALECQVSRGDYNGEVVGQYCNHLGYASR